MKLLITGGAGFVGARLARDAARSAARSPASRSSSSCWPTSFAPAAAADLLDDARVEARTGTLLDAVRGASKPSRFDGVFHLASAVSGECEADFELGLRSNLDSTRALLDALRASTAAATSPRFVFSSSVAVFGPDAGSADAAAGAPTTRCPRRRPRTARRS